jgi:allantoin racemase
MPRLLVVNPNTTATMTQAIGAVARAAALPGTEIVARNPSRGPAAIEGPYDQACCLEPLLEEILRGAHERCDATIVACFDDPGVAAARALVAGPVLGIAEAAMHAASMVAARWAVVTTVQPAVATIKELVSRYGAGRACAGVRAADVGVLALEHPTAETRRLVLDAAAALVNDQHAEAIILGCAGMSGLRGEIARTLDVPVIDGVAAAVRFAENLIALGLATSKRGTYATPTKTIAGGAQ